MSSTLTQRRHADADLVVAFLNTFDVDTGSDELDTQGAWSSWAGSHDLPAPEPLALVRDVRAALRAAADGEDGPDLTVPVAAGIVDGRPGTVATSALGAIALAAARLVASGDWARIKLCADRTCRWAFLDTSRNRSRTWCSMDVCGNRAKARAFRARAKGD